MVVILKRATRILPYFFVFISSLYLPTDPDLGWHLKYGEYFFIHHQVLRDNIFSTMMPAYHWINGTWGTDVITYVLYKAGGFLGLTLAGALIVTATFFFLARSGGFDFLSESILFPLFVYLLYPANDSSFRGQQVSYLCLGILLFILSKYKPFTKLFFFIPLLFLIWCNIHEEAFLCLTLFGGWTLFILIRNQLNSRHHDKKILLQENLFLIGILVLSFLITLLNPFGAGLWSNAFSYIGNPLVKNISEYAPYSLFSNGWWNQISVSILLIPYLIYLFLKKKLNRHFPIVIMSMILLLLGFGMRRYLWPAYYVVLSFMRILSQITQKSLKKYETTVGVVISLLSILIVIQYKLPFTQFTTMSWDMYCSLQGVPCSPKSAEYMQKHHLTHTIFSYYDWGGWLIWNYPEVKPSIDGRMTEWTNKNGYSAVTDYYAYENAQKSIETSPYNTVYLPNNESPLALELSQLIQRNKWKVAYEDDYAGVVVRIKK